LAELWRSVLAEHYDHLRPELLGPPRQCYSLHFTYRFDGLDYVISRVRRERHRMPFGTQIDVMRRLSAAGLRFVEPPIRPTSVTGDIRWVDKRPYRWFVRSYIRHDPEPDWSSLELVADAADKLAQVHNASRAPEEWPALQVPGKRLDPYHWPVSEFLTGIDRLARDMAARHRTESEVRQVRQVLEQLRDEQPHVCLGPLGLTHQDFRPENVLARDRQVAAIIDWDRAQWDYQLYDAILGALHIAEQRPGGPDLELAGQFVSAYREHAIGWTADDAAVDWMFRFAVIRNLAVSRSPAKWTRLLDAVETKSRAGILVQS